MRYDFAKKKKIDERLVILADSNCDETPESMELVKAELEERGYEVKEMYLDFSKHGAGAVMKYMMSFMKSYANAKAVFICNYFVPCTACRKREETSVVQLWHSCGGLKKFGYDTPDDINSHYKGNVTKNFDLITVSSAECIGFFNSAFRLTKSIVKPLGVSRTDIFFDKDFKDECKEEFFGEYPEYKGKKIVLYAPTFRGNASDPYVVGQSDVLRLKEKLGEDWALIVKLHPRLDDGGMNCDFETNRLLPVADVLISDYSSVVFEYALLRKPLVLFVPDLAEYSEKRSFYLDYEEEMPGTIVTDGGRLCEAVKDSYENFDSSVYEDFIEKYMSACDGNSTERIVDFALRD